MALGAIDTGPVLLAGSGALGRDAGASNTGRWGVIVSAKGTRVMLTLEHAVKPQKGRKCTMS